MCPKMFKSLSILIIFEHLLLSTILSDHISNAIEFNENITSFIDNEDLSLVSSAVIKKSIEIQDKLKNITNLGENAHLLFNKTNKEEKEEEEVLSEDYFDIPDYSDIVSHVNYSIDLIQDWSTKSNLFLNMISTAAIPFAFQIGTESDLSPQCTASLLQIASGIKHQKPWAIIALDSFGRISPGFLYGTVTSFGEFQECIDIEFPGHFKKSDVVGKYCILRINFPMPPKPKRLQHSSPIIDLSGTKFEGTIWDHWAKHFNFFYSTNGFRFGICIPSSCSSQELEAVIKKIVEPVIRMPIYLDQDHECTTRRDSVSITFYSAISLSVFTSLTTLVVVSTLVEFWIHRKHKSNFFSKVNTDTLNWIQKMCLSFSAISNTRRLFKINLPEESHLSSLHGIQVLSIFWIITGHTYCFGAIYEITFTLKRLNKDLFNFSEKMIYQALSNTYLIADSIFFLSGLILISVALPALQQHRLRFNIFSFIIHRWIKLVATVTGLTLFYFLFPFLSSGPIYKNRSNRLIKNCENNWWYNLLGFGNWFTPIENMCASETWLIEADFQLYLLAPILLLAYHKSQKSGYIVNIIFIGFGVLASGLTSFFTDSSPTFEIDHIIDPEYLRYQIQVAHFPTYHHFAPFGIGILVGYLLLKFCEDTKSWSIPSKVRFFFWLLLPLSSLSILILAHFWNVAQEAAELNKIIKILFAAFQRPIWCLGIAWIILCCGTGKGGVVNDLLSWKRFIPLSRLSFCIYTVHLVPIYIRAYSIKYTTSWDDYYFISWSIFNIILSIIGGYILYILFESPFCSLGKHVLNSRKIWKPNMASNVVNSCEKFSQQKKV